MCRSFIGKDVVVHTINKERKQTTTFKWNEPSKNILLLRPSPTAPPLAIIQYEDLHWIPTILHGIWEHWLHLFPQYKYTSCFSCKINSFLLCFLSPIGMFSRKQLLFFFNVWKEENQEGRLIDGQRRKDLGQIWGAHCVVSDHECTYGWWWMGNEQHTVVFLLAFPNMEPRRTSQYHTVSLLSISFLANFKVSCQPNQNRGQLISVPRNLP